MWNVTATALRRWTPRYGFTSTCRLLSSPRRHQQLLLPVTSGQNGQSVAALHTSVLAAGSRTAESMANERRRLPRVTSAGDLPVVEAREDLVRTALGTDFGEPGLAQAMDAFREAFEYNMPGGKRGRLLAVVQTYELLAEDDAPYLHQACLVGWCVELLQCYFLVLDDIMDNSAMRRGRPSWHMRPDVGMRAINDALFLEKSVGWVLRQRLGSLPCYLALFELFHEADLRTVLGQELDMVSATEGAKGWAKERPSLDRYWATVDFKTGFYSFVLPMRAGMLLAGVEDSRLHEQAQAAALSLGRLFQVRDDYIDCYGSPETIGKVGTDIVDRKCSWLLVTALGLASPEQVQRIQAHVGHGVPGGADEAAVKAVYQELDMPAHYAKYREGALRELDAQIGQLPAKLADVLSSQRDAFLRLDSSSS